MEKEKILRALNDFYETIKVENYNEFTHVWSRGYIKGFRQAIEELTQIYRRCAMDEMLCAEKHLQITKELDLHNTRLNAHAEEIEELKMSDATNKNEIKNLCKQMGSLTKAIWGLVLMVGGSLVSFFFYAVQSQIFK